MNTHGEAAGRLGWAKEMAQEGALPQWTWGWGWGQFKAGNFFFFTLKFILFMYSLLHPFQNEKMCLSSMQILLNPPSFLPQVKNEGEGLPVGKW